MNPRRRVGGRMRWLLAGLGLALLLAGGEGGVLAEGGEGAPERTVRVCVVDHAGKPVPSARIFVFGAAGPPLSRARVGGDGCRALVPPAGATEMLVRAAGRSPARVPLAPRGEDAERKVVLGEAISLSIRVLDGRTGRPVPSWKFLAEPSAEEWSRNEWLEAEAMVAGSVDLREGEEETRLDGLPGPAADVLVIAPGYQMEFLHVERDSGPAVVRLRAEGCVAATVLDAETGGPLEGVRAVPAVFLPEGASPGNPGGSERWLRRFAVGVSDAGGKIVLCPPGGRPTPFVFSAADHVHRTVTVDPAAGGTLRVELFRAASLELVALEREAGTPLPGLPVRVSAEEAGFSAEKVTGPDGRATFERVPSRVNCRVELLAPGKQEVLWRTTEAAAPAARVRDRAYVEVAAAIRVSLGGEPLAVTSLVLVDPEAEDLPRVTDRSRTDETGIARFLTRRVPPHALLALRAGDGVLVERFPRTGSGGREGVTRLEIAGRWARLRVLDGSSGKPIAGALARCLEGDGAAAPRTVAISPEGEEGSPLWFPQVGMRLLPGDPGLLALAGSGGRMHLFVPRSCGGLSVEGPPSSEGIPFREVKVDSGDLGDGETVVKLESMPGIRVLPMFEGAPPRIVSVDLRRWDAPWFVSASRRQATADVLRLPAGRGGPWLVVLRAEGYAPAAEGPVESGPDWPQLPLHLVKGGFVEVRGAAPAGGKTGRWSLSGPGGLDWAPWVDVVEFAVNGGGRGLRIGPVPPGEWTFAAEGCEKTARVRFAGDVARVSCE